MAGESVSYSELKNWYDVFNDVITNYGGGIISSLTTPSADSTVVPANVNNIYNKISEFKADEYFSTEPQLYSNEYALVSAGTQLLRSNQVAPIETTVNGIKQIKCRNRATYSNQNYSNGSNSSGNKSNGNNGNGTCSNENYGNGYYGNGTNSSGTNSLYAHTSNGFTNILKSNTSKSCGTKSLNHYSNGEKSNGNNSNVPYQNGPNTYGECTQGVCSSGTTIDILNAKVSA